MGQSQPKAQVVDPKIYRTIYPKADRRALAESIRQSEARAAASMADIERMVGASTAQIGARNAAALTGADASYLSSLPATDIYMQATTGIADRNAAARQAAEQNLALSKSYSDQAAQAAASYVPDPFKPTHFAWEDLPNPGNRKDNSKSRMAGDKLA